MTKLINTALVYLYIDYSQLLLCTISCMHTDPKVRYSVWDIQVNMIVSLYYVGATNITTYRYTTYKILNIVY